MLIYLDSPFKANALYLNDTGSNIRDKINLYYMYGCKI